MAKFGGGLEFNHLEQDQIIVNKYPEIKINDLNSTGISLGGWMYVPSSFKSVSGFPTAFDVPIFCKGTGSSNVDYMIAIEGLTDPAYAYNFRVRTFNGAYVNNRMNSTTKLTFDEWVHLMGVYDNNNMKIYLNGQVVATLPVTGNIVSSTFPLQIRVRTDFW